MAFPTYLIRPYLKKKKERMRRYTYCDHGGTQSRCPNMSWWLVKLPTSDQSPSKILNLPKWGTNQAMREILVPIRTSSEFERPPTLAMYTS